MPSNPSHTDFIHFFFKCLVKTVSVFVICFVVLGALLSGILCLLLLMGIDLLLEPLFWWCAVFIDFQVSGLIALYKLDRSV